MYIVPKAKKIIGYGYFSFYILDIILNIVDYFTGVKWVSRLEAGITLGMIVGTIFTLFMVSTTKFENED